MQIPVISRFTFFTTVKGYYLLFLAASNDNLNDEIADIICRYTPREFRNAVFTSSDHFLYRGESTTTINVPSILLHPEPDLLVEGTYTDRLALKYFTHLEERLCPTRARPSTGHIAASCVETASKWGEVVSVWPLGNHISYVYPRDKKVFFPGNFDDDIIVDRNLSDALMNGREVLFTSWFDPKMENSFPDGFNSSWVSAFLAVSMEATLVLKETLKERKYGL
jgi:hypothetical protein